ncbi:MAG: hypothetical protein IT306_29650 [Chloroflexi bacterium]|nr:hypothetical protein [Chloroflexota bacterium]
MTKEIERAGIPVAMISALQNVALNGGAPRVVHGARIEHVCGNPGLTPEMDRDFGRRIVEAALAAIRTAVSGPTLFEPGSRTPSTNGGES